MRLIVFILELIFGVCFSVSGLTGFALLILFAFLLLWKQKVKTTINLNDVILPPDIGNLSLIRKSHEEVYEMLVEHRIGFGTSISSMNISELQTKSPAISHQIFNTSNDEESEISYPVDSLHDIKVNLLNSHMVLSKNLKIEKLRFQKKKIILILFYK